MPRRGAALATAVLLFAAGAAGLAGCGDSGSEGPATPNSTPGSEDADASPAEIEALVAKLGRGKLQASLQLVEIGGPAVPALTELAETSQTGKSMDEQLGISEAQNALGQIAGKDLEAVQPLIDALEQRDYAQIVKLPSFYVALGKPGSEKILAEAVGRYYPRGAEYGGLPFSMLASGNEKLERAVIQELEDAGFTVSGDNPGPGTLWGSSGAYRQSTP